MNWDIVYPFLNTDEESELEELKNKRTYVAGFTDAEVENRPDLYDIFLNGRFFTLKKKIWSNLAKKDIFVNQSAKI